MLGPLSSGSGPKATILTIVSTVKEGRTAKPFFMLPSLVNSLVSNYFLLCEA